MLKPATGVVPAILPRAAIFKGYLPLNETIGGLGGSGTTCRLPSDPQLPIALELSASIPSFLVVAPGFPGVISR
jgi:hypothetical protein